MTKTKKEWVWEIYGYSGSVWAYDWEEARDEINGELCIQEANEDYEDE